MHPPIKQDMLRYEAGGISSIGIFYTWLSTETANIMFALEKGFGL